MKNALSVFGTALVASAGICALLAAGYFIYLEAEEGYVTGLFGTVTVAVLDTGIDTRIPALQSRLALNRAERPDNKTDDDRNGYVDDVNGWNFWDSNGDLTDASGHGTKVALIIADKCPKCTILPVKISKSGAGVTPSALAAAVRYAVESGATLINISVGVSEGSQELEDAVKRAAQRDITIVTAAGTGIGNPFRPDPLENVYPQSYPEVIVVGAARSIAEPDPLMNYGDALDVIVTGQSEAEFGSSMAAAVVSGHVATYLKTHPRYDPRTIRSLLHGTASLNEQLNVPAPRLAQYFQRLGSGSFEPERFLRRSRERGVVLRAKHAAAEDTSLIVQLSSDRPLPELTVTLTCQGRPKPFQAKVRTGALKKGRAFAFFDPRDPGDSAGPLAPGTTCALETSVTRQTHTFCF